MCCHEHSIYTDALQRQCKPYSVVMLQLRAGNLTGVLACMHAPDSQHTLLSGRQLVHCFPAVSVCRCTFLQQRHCILSTTPSSPALHRVYVCCCCCAGQLQSIMPQVAVLHQHGLISLDLSRNQLTGELPAELDQLNNLQQLLLGANSACVLGCWWARAVCRCAASCSRSAHSSPWASRVCHVMPWDCAVQG
jgi:hypothetical protein